jgi:predicted nucleic acid-binding protein
VIDANLAVWTVLPVVAGENVVPRFEAWGRQGVRLAAPMLWLAEATSAIRLAVYSRAVSDQAGQAALDGLFDLEVEAVPLDAQLCRSAFEWAGRLGQARAYDGFYLALAEQLGAEFWTADRRLSNGARQVGAHWVRWVGEPAGG